MAWATSSSIAPKSSDPSGADAKSPGARCSAPNTDGMQVRLRAEGRRTRVEELGLRKKAEAA